MKDGIFEFLLALVIFGVCVGMPAWGVSEYWEERRREGLVQEKNSLEGELKILSQQVDGKTVRPLLRILDLEAEINRLEREVGK
jgi:hypothetical protein